MIALTAGLRPVKVTWHVGDKRLTYAAEIERVGAEIASSTGGVDAYAVIQDDEAASYLRPGAFVWVEVPDRKYVNVLRAPDTALYGNDLVYVVQDQRLSPRHIQVQGYAGDDVLFTAQDEVRIDDGEQIVITQIREGGVGIKVEVR